jgi:hypothetical protein
MVSHSFTHISRPDIGTDLDVSQPSQPARHDNVTGWWIPSSGELAAEACELGQIVRLRFASSAHFCGVRQKLIQHVDLAIRPWHL